MVTLEDWGRGEGWEKWKGRNRTVLYKMDPTIDPKLVEWDIFPMPRNWSEILDYGDNSNKDIIASGKDENGEYSDILRLNLFSNTYHWIEPKEDPDNVNLYPHLALEYQDQIDEIDDDIRELGDFGDGGPDFDDVDTRYNDGYEDGYEDDENWRNKH